MTLENASMKIERENARGLDLVYIYEPRVRTSSGLSHT